MDKTMEAGTVATNFLAFHTPAHSIAKSSRQLGRVPPSAALARAFDIAE
jgi:hypothetical protein